MTLPMDIKDREMRKFVEDGDGNVALRTAITVEDIEIGAVELKDATTDTRAVIKTDGTDNALVVQTKALTDGSQIVQLYDSHGHPITSTEEDIHTCLDVYQPDVEANGTLTALNSTVVINCNNRGSGLVSVTGTWKGKIDIQGHIDGVWVSLGLVQPTGAIIRTGLTNDAQNGAYRILIPAGYTQVQAIMTTYTSGTATIYFNFSTAVASPFVWQLNQANLNATVYQPTGTNLHTVVDSGSITINNGTDGSAVNIQDGGNSITIDNSNIDVALSTRLKPADTLNAVTTVGTITNEVKINDNGNSITVDNIYLDSSLSGIKTDLDNTYTRLGDGNQKAQIVDGAGHTIDSVLDSNNDYHLGVATIQSIYVDAHNSSSTNLLAGATFTGTSTTSLGINAIQVNIKADQNCTVFVDQSMNGTDWDITDSFTYYYSKGGQSWTTQATASYLRVRVTNLNTTTATTTFRLQTALCPIVEALPRSLTALGNLKVATQEIGSVIIPNKSALVSPMNALKVTESTRLVGVPYFGSTLDAIFWTGSVIGTGANTVSGGQLTQTTGATANSTVSVQSVRIARYVSANTNFYRAQVRVPAVSLVGVGATNIRRWGAFNANDGFFFEYDGTTLKVVARKATVDTAVSSGSFNGTGGSTYALDTNCHTFEIYWTNRNAYFVIDDVALHTITSLTAPATSTLHFNARSENNNGGGNTGVNTLEIRTASISRLGQASTRPIWYYQSGAQAGIALKVGPGTLHTIANNKGTGTLITLYDSPTTTANPICVIDASKNVGNLTYDLDFYNGLWLVCTGAVDITVVYE